MAVTKGIKKKEHENLSAANIERVIGLLEAEKPVTKKEACEILNISYNTTRLNKIIETHKEEKAEDQRRRAANRGKPILDHEKSTIIALFLGGDSVTEIAKILYRSTGSIKAAIEELGIPERSETYDPKDHAMLPEQCVKTEFKTGELVWVVAKNTIAVIREPSAHGTQPDDENVYATYEFERLEQDSPYFANCRAGEYAGRYGAHRASNLGSLEHLKQHGIDLYKTYTPHFPRTVKKFLGMEVK